MKNNIQIIKTDDSELLLCHTITGTIMKYPVIKREIKDMYKPVVCTHCNAIYDLADVEVIQRYEDCDVYCSPCCKTDADTREWKNNPDIIPLNIFLQKTIK